MAFQVNSQNISKEESVKTLIDTKGDTLIIMSISNGKILLADVLECEITDSLFRLYSEKDLINKNTIMLQKNVIDELNLKNTIKDKEIDNLEKISSNKDTVIGLKDVIIKKQKKEIVKQKILKIIGFSLDIILPITVLVLLIK